MKLKDRLNEISKEAAESRSQSLSEEYTNEISRLLLLTQNHVKWLKSNFKDELKKSAYAGEHNYITTIYGEPKLPSNKDDENKTYSNFDEFKRIDNDNYHVFLDSEMAVGSIHQGLKFTEFSELEKIVDEEGIKMVTSMLKSKDEDRYFIVLMLKWLEDKNE